MDACCKEESKETCSGEVPQGGLGIGPPLQPPWRRLMISTLFYVVRSAQRLEHVQRLDLEIGVFYTPAAVRRHGRSTPVQSAVQFVDECSVPEVSHNKVLRL